MPRGDENGAAVARPEPDIVVEDLGIIGVVEHQQPRLRRAVEIVPDQVGGSATPTPCRVDLMLRGSAVVGDGEHAVAERRGCRRLDPQPDDPGAPALVEDRPRQCCFPASSRSVDDVRSTSTLSMPACRADQGSAQSAAVPEWGTGRRREGNPY